MNRIWAWPQSRRTYRPPSVRPLSGGRSKLSRSEEHTSELQSQSNLVCRLLLEKKKHPLHLVYSPCHPLIMNNYCLFLSSVISHSHYVPRHRLHQLRFSLTDANHTIHFPFLAPL